MCAVEHVMFMLVLQDQVSEHLKHSTPVEAPVTILYSVMSKFYQGLNLCVCASPVPCLCKWRCFSSHYNFKTEICHLFQYS